LAGYPLEATYDAQDLNPSLLEFKSSALKHCS